MSRKRSKEVEFQGLGVSPGVAIGRAELYLNEVEETAVIQIPPDGREDEVKRYFDALSSVKEHLAGDARIVSKMIGRPEAAIYIAQLEMLKGTLFQKAIPEGIMEKGINAEAVVLDRLKSFERMEEGLSGSHSEMREKHKMDIRDLKRHIIGRLMKKNPQCLLFFDDVILVAPELLPSDITLFSQRQVLGIVTETGGRNSHAAILARSQGIPAVMGINRFTRKVGMGDGLIIDGSSGSVYLNPKQKTRKRYLEKRDREISARQEMERLIDLPSVTTDGVHVSIMANIGRSEDASLAKKYGAQGIGLFRTELPFLMGEHFVSEDEQYELYREVISMMDDLPVTIRTLDLGGDKFFAHDLIDREDNPFLGLRSIRFSMKYADIFLTQLRAILRASAHGRVKIMFPMVTSIVEIEEILKIYEAAKKDVIAKGIKPKHEPALGIMIEVPSAALMAGEFLRHFEFASIGTNDLIQYTLAVDRGNRAVSGLYTPYEPSVLKLIAMVAKAGKACGKEVNVCGEMASNPLLASLLVGLGIRVLSMEPRSILRAKSALLSTDAKRAEAVARRVLGMATPLEVENFLRNELHVNGI
ncbi:MAG: phosphoenolpyruvate--protein phosphotransferase [Deltaproteobacteria bacterium]|uniref:Phosphoenolpyruvate-protein phosphotransferase n=1 Tax=Candidatus Zymogenus saltonus TaxID=2844893 RepID=A0A9D8KIE1_9DELT|nr:phosphoenolpyruvate--protein phosphotransferase [Candidatus Zymogenus saltonus]